VSIDTDYTTTTDHPGSDTPIPPVIRPRFGTVAGTEPDPLPPWPAAALADPALPATA
jgi:hypothetical protein